MRPAIRLAALMQAAGRSTSSRHDSIGLGQDGPTHQPIEQLAALRAMPGLIVLRPADANETVEAWRVVAGSRRGPVCLVAVAPGAADARPRQATRPPRGLAQGGYVLADAEGGAPRGDPDGDAAAR